MPSEGEVPHMDHRTTWRGRLLGLVTTGGIIAVASPAMHFARLALEHRNWRVGGTFDVSDPARFDPGLSSEERLEIAQLWYGRFYVLPPGVLRGGLQATLAAGVLCVVFAGFGLIMSLLASSERHGKYFRRFWPIIYSIAVLASLIAFIYSFVETFTSSNIDVDAFVAAGPRPRPTRYSDELSEPPFPADGTWNIEAWSCQLRPIQEDLSTFGLFGSNPCNNARIARWLTLPLFILSSLLLLSSIVYPPWRASSKQQARTENATEMSSSGDPRASTATGRTSTTEVKEEVV